MKHTKWIPGKWVMAHRDQAIPVTDAYPLFQAIVDRTDNIIRVALFKSRVEYVKRLRQG